MLRRMAVLGVGANGSCIGADLTKANYDVTLIDQWPAHVAAMKTEGLRVKLIRTGDEFNVPVRAVHLCELASLKAEFDLVFLVCKAYDAAWHAQLIKPYLSAEGVLVTAQNSICDEWIAPVIGAERCIPSAVELSSQIFEPGLVKRNTGLDSAKFVVGEPDGKTTKRIEELARIMSVVGGTEVTNNIWGAKWSKLVQSTAALTLMPVLGVPGMALLEEPYLDLSIKLGVETARVANALGYALEPIFGMPREEFKRAKLEGQVWIILHKIMTDLGKQGTDELEKKMVGKPAEAAQKGTARWLDAPTQDLVKGRLTETNWLNGLVVRKGREVNVPTPLNEMLNSMMKEIEQGKREMLNPANFDGFASLLRNG